MCPITALQRVLKRLKEICPIICLLILIYCSIRLLVPDGSSDLKPTKKPEYRYQDILESEHSWKAFMKSLTIIRNRTTNQKYYHWPRSLGELYVDPVTGLYDLSINPLINQELSPETEDTDPNSEILSALSDGETMKHPLLKRMLELEKTFRIDSRVPGVHYYPDAIDVEKTLNLVKNGQPVTTVPINDPPMPILKLPNNVCCPHNCQQKLDLLVLVKTCIYCFDRRLKARQTFMKPKLWGNFRVGFVFSVGMIGETYPEQFQFPNYNVTLKRLPEIYRTNPWMLMNEVMNESAHYGDLLIGAYVDTYYNLTTKLILGLRWISLFCNNHTPLTLHIDDDMAIIPENLFKLIGKISPKAQRGFLGGAASTYSVLRPNSGSRWAVSEEELPWPSYPPYFFGIGYFLGADVIKDIAILAAFTRYFRIDDCYLGILLHKLNKPMYRINQINMSKKRSVPNQIVINTELTSSYIDWETGDLK